MHLLRIHGVFLALDALKVAFCPATAKTGSFLAIVDQVVVERPRERVRSLVRRARDTRERRVLRAFDVLRRVVSDLPRAAHKLLMGDLSRLLLLDLIVDILLKLT